MKNRNIQFMRGVSILLVLLAHADQVYPKEITTLKELIDPTIGVDLFFIISGYLMGVTFLNKINHPISLSDATNFYVKRTNRLLVACVFWSLVPLFFFSYWKSVGAITDIKNAIWIFVTSTFFVGNFYSYIHPSGFGYFWSLGVEYQFYLMLPLIACLGKSNKGMFFIILALFAIYAIAMRDFSGAWLFRPYGLYVGLAIWLLTKTTGFNEVKSSINKSGNIKIFMAVLFIIFSSTAISAAIIQFSGLSFAITPIILGLAFVIIICKDSPVAGFLSRPIEFIGDISFSLYLCNIPVFIYFSVLTFKFTDNPHVVYAVCFVMSVIISTISRHTLEKIDLIRGNR
ncbi:acyltransferase family protein [Citrobacter freundii]